MIKKPKESVIENYLKKRVKEEGGELRKVKWIAHRGAPDRLMLMPGFATYIELKRPGEELEDHQRREHAKLKWAKIPVLTINSIRGVESALRGHYD